MVTLGAAELIEVFRNISIRMAEEKSALCELDGQIGDADHGIAMEQGFSAVDAALAKLDPQSATLTEIFNTAAKSFLNAIGASTGPLYATAFMRAGKAMTGCNKISREEVPQILIAMAQGIADRGKAQLGDKTMFDVWGPVAQASEAGKSSDEIVEIARTGSQATREMTAKLGRSARLGERSIGHLDPGAVSAAIIVELFCKVEL